MAAFPAVRRQAGETLSGAAGKTGKSVTKNALVHLLK